MGIWSTDNFGNDTTLDFIREITAIEILVQTFNTSDSEGNWIELEHSPEIVAAALDRPCDRTNKRITGWKGSVDQAPQPEFIEPPEFGTVCYLCEGE